MKPSTQPTTDNSRELLRFAMGALSAFLDSSTEARRVRKDQDKNCATSSIAVLLFLLLPFAILCVLLLKKAFGKSRWLSGIIPHVQSALARAKYAF
jgi:hypothetical protein